MKRVYVRVDARNRISLTKVTSDLPGSFYAYTEDGKIILEPIIEMSKEEAWLFEPENKHLLEHLKEGLKQKGTIRRGSFAKYLK